MKRAIVIIAVLMLATSLVCQAQSLLDDPSARHCKLYPLNGQEARHITQLPTKMASIALGDVDLSLTADVVLLHDPHQILEIDGLAPGVSLLAEHLWGSASVGLTYIDRIGLGAYATFINVKF